MDRRRPPPYWQSKEYDNGPEGKYNEAANTNIIRRFWWRLFDCRERVRRLSFAASAVRRLTSLIRRPLHAAAEPVVGALVALNKMPEWLLTACMGEVGLH